MDNGKANRVKKLPYFFYKAGHRMNALMTVDGHLDLVEDVFETSGGGESFPFLTSVTIVSLTVAASPASKASRAAGTRTRCSATNWMKDSMSSFMDSFRASLSTRDGHADSTSQKMSSRVLLS